MPWRHYIVENFRWKLSALLLAIFTWFSVQFARWRGFGDTQTQSVPRQRVEVLTRPGDARTFHVEPAEVDILIRAAAAGMKNLGRDPLHVFVDLTDFPDAQGVIREVHIRAPEEVEIVRIEPKAVYVESAGAARTALTNSVTHP